MVFMDMQLLPTRYGITPAIQARFEEIKRLIPPAHQNVLANFGVRFAGFRRGEGLFASELFDITIDTNRESGLAPKAAEIRQAIETYPFGQNSAQIAHLIGSKSDWKIAKVNIPPGCMFPLSDMMREDQGLRPETDLGRWFLREMWAFNSQTAGFFGVSDPFLPYVTLGPNEFYLFPDCALVNRNAYSAQPFSHEAALVPFRLVEHAQTWNAAHPSGAPIELGFFWYHNKTVVFREEQNVIEKNLSINIGVHEAAHALQYFLEVKNKTAEAALRNACVIACEKALHGQGLACLLPPVEIRIMASDPQHETVPRVYQTVHSLDPSLAGRVAAADSDFWEAYQVIERLGS